MAAAYFYLFPSTEISIEGTALLWYYWHNKECDGRAEKFFTKWLPGMFPTPLKSLAEVYSCTRGLFWRKCNFNYCMVLCVSGIKLFGEYFAAAIYLAVIWVTMFATGWFLSIDTTVRNILQRGYTSGGRKFRRQTWRVMTNGMHCH